MFERVLEHGVPGEQVGEAGHVGLEQSLPHPLGDVTRGVGHGASSIAEKRCGQKSDRRRWQGLL